MPCRWDYPQKSAFCSIGSTLTVGHGDLASDLDTFCALSQGHQIRSAQIGEYSMLDSAQ